MRRLTRETLKNEYHKILAERQEHLAEYHKRRNLLAYDVEAGRRPDETTSELVLRGLRDEFLAMYGPFIAILARLENEITAIIGGFLHHPRAQREAEALAALERARELAGRNRGPMSAEDQSSIVELYAQARLQFWAATSGIG